MFIAEQQMIGAAVGLSVRHYVPFASTFAAFFTRAYDFIRMAAISQASIRLSGSHAGVEIGADGPSQMALEDLAMMRAVHGSTVLYPSDGTSTAALVREMADQPGISYLRTTRGSYPVLYDATETFPISGSKVLRSTPDDAVALIGAGVTLHACLAAAENLAADGILAASSTSTRSSHRHPNAACCRRSHRMAAQSWPKTTIPRGPRLRGDPVLLDAGPQTLRVTHLAVREMPGSGTGEELMAAAWHRRQHRTEAAARNLLNAEVTGSSLD
jgi:transketolase